MYTVKVVTAGFMVWLSLVAQSSALEDCVNGVDRDKVNATQCDCAWNGTVYFSGEGCEVILLNATTVTTTARTGLFVWPQPPNIAQSEYIFVYREEQDEGLLFRGTNRLLTNTLYTQNFQMINETTARIIELDSGYVNYTVCVQGSLLDVNDSLVDASLVNCVALQTQTTVQWDQELAFYLVSGFMLITVIVLIIARLLADRRHEEEDTIKECGAFENDLIVTAADDLEEDVVSGDNAEVVVDPPAADYMSLNKGTLDSRGQVSNSSYQNLNSLTPGHEHGSPSRDRLLPPGGLDAAAAASRDTSALTPSGGNLNNETEPKPSFETDSSEFVRKGSTEGSGSGSKDTQPIGAKPSEPQPDY